MNTIDLTANHAYIASLPTEHLVAKKEKREARLRSARSVAELTFGAVTPRKRPEDFKELRRLDEESVAEVIRLEP